MSQNFLPFLKRALCYAIVFSMVGNDMAFAMMRGKAASDFRGAEPSNRPPLQRRPSVPDISVQETPDTPEESLPPSQRASSATTAAPISIPSSGLGEERGVSSPVLSFVAASVGAMVLEELPPQSPPLIPLAILSDLPTLEPIPFEAIAAQVQNIIEGREGREGSEEREIDRDRDRDRDGDGDRGGDGDLTPVSPTGASSLVTDPAPSSSQPNHQVISSLPGSPPQEDGARGREFSSYSRSGSSSEGEGEGEPAPAPQPASGPVRPLAPNAQSPAELLSIDIWRAQRANGGSEAPPTETTPLLGSLRGRYPFPSPHGSIQDGETPPPALQRVNELGDFIYASNLREDDPEAALLLSGGGNNLNEAKQALQSIEGRRCFHPWIYWDHFIEKVLYALTLRKGSKGCCQSHPLWIEGEGVPLKSGLNVARAISAFRVGFEYMIFQPLGLILTALMDYQIYEQLAGHKDFNPIDIIGVWWNGDEQSLRGALSVLVQNPQNAPYFMAFFAMPLIWGIGNVARTLWNVRHESRETFQETIDAVTEFSHPREGCCSGLWTDKGRWLFPFPKMDGEVSDLIEGLLLDGRLTLAEREGALDALINFTRNATGYAKLSGLSGLQRVAVGTSLNQLNLVERTFGTQYKNAILLEKFRALEELRRQNPGVWKAGFKGLIHNMYANYLRWAMGDFNGKINTPAWALFKAAKLALSIYLYVEIAQQIIEYLKCPKPLQQGFNAAMQPAEFSSEYNQGCFEAYLSVFNRVPGQPPETLVNLMPKFKLAPSYTLFNLSGAGATGEQVAGLIMGLRTYQPHIHLTQFDLSNNEINTVSGMTALMGALNATQQAAPSGAGVKYLDISGNGINTLSDPAWIVFGQSLSALPALQSLDLSMNGVGVAGAISIGEGMHFLSQLRAFDLSFNFIDSDGAIAVGKGLPYLAQLQNLDLSGNSISSPQENGAIAIGENLRFLTKLQTLNLSQNFICLLSCENAIFTISSSFKYLSQLQTLDLSLNNYIGLHDTTATIAIGENLRFLTKLQTLNLAGNYIGNTGENGTIAIVEGLRFLPQLQTLDLSMNKIGSTGDNGTVTIGRGLRFLPKLQTLDLSHNQLGSTGENGTVAIGEELRFLPQLQDLDLSYNEIGKTGENGTVAIGEGLQSLTVLKSLDLSNNAMLSDFSSVVTSIVHLKVLDTLYVQQLSPLPSSQLALLRVFWNHRNNQTDIYALVTPQDVKDYLSSLPNSTSVVNLSGSIVDPRPEIFSLLFSELTHFTSLQTLNLSYNAIGPEGAIAIGKGLPYIPQLQALDLSQNEIGMNANGTIAIGEGLRFLTNLQTLDLSYNGVGSSRKGIVAIAEDLQFLPQLKFLGLSGSSNEYADYFAICIAKALPFLTQLRSLDFANNPIGMTRSNGTVALGEALPYLTQLQALDLSGDFIGWTGDEGAVAIGGGLKYLTNLQSLDLSVNNIGETGTIAIAEALPYLTQLQVLGFSGVGIGDAGDEGTVAIGVGLRYLTNLRALDLSDNSIGESKKGTVAIGDGLPYLTQLETLNLSENDLGEYGLQSILNSLPPLICDSLQTINLGENNFTSIPWGPAAQQLQGLYAAQIQTACEANRCFGTPVQVDAKALRCSGVQLSITPPPPPSQRVLLSAGDFSASGSVMIRPTALDRDALVPYDDSSPTSTGLVPYKKPSLAPAKFEEEHVIDLRPSLFDLFTSSVGRGAVMTIVPEVLKDLLRAGGVSKRSANVATALAQLGMTFYMTTSYLPTLTGMGVNVGLTTMGVDPSVSSSLGNTAALGVSLAQGAVITPATLAISMGGSMVGSTLAMNAKNIVMSWLSPEEEVPQTHAHIKQTRTQGEDGDGETMISFSRSLPAWAYLRANLVLFIWGTIILTLLLGERVTGQK